MQYLVYQITNNKDGKIYIGVHQTQDLDDGYMGSGTILRRAIQKHGIENFTKTILGVYNTPEAMFAKEAELITEDFIGRPDTYNLRVGGMGGWDYINNTATVANKKNHLAPSARKAAYQKLTELKLDPLWKAHWSSAIGVSLKKHYAVNKSHWLGRKHTPESIAKQRAVAKAENRGVGSKNPAYGKKWMTNGTESKSVTKNDQDALLRLSWKFGRIINVRN